MHAGNYKFSIMFKNRGHTENKGYDKIFFNKTKTTEMVILFNSYF